MDLSPTDTEKPGQTQVTISVDLRPMDTEKPRQTQVTIYVDLRPMDTEKPRQTQVTISVDLVPWTQKSRGRHKLQFLWTYVPRTQKSRGRHKLQYQRPGSSPHCKICHRTATAHQRCRLTASVQVVSSAITMTTTTTSTIRILMIDYRIQCRGTGRRVENNVINKVGCTVRCTLPLHHKPRTSSPTRVFKVLRHRPYRSINTIM